MNCVHCNELLSSQQIDIYATTRIHSNIILADYMKKVLNCEVNKHSNYMCKVCYGIFTELDLAQLQCTRLSDRIFERWIFIENNNGTRNICIETSDEKPKELEITHTIDGTYKSFTNNTRSIKKPHDCKHCKKKFVSKLGLALHLQRKHGNQSDELSAKHIKSEIDYAAVEMLEPLVIDESSCSSSSTSKPDGTLILNPSIYSDLIKSEVIEPNVENSLISAKGKTRKKKPIAKSNSNYEPLHVENTKNDIKKPHSEPLLTQFHVETTLNDDPTSKQPTIKEEDAEPLNDESSSNSSNDDSDKSKTKKKKPARPLKPLKYSCPQCAKMWRTMSELRTHVETHSAARPYICEICGQAYKHKSALDIHVGMHNGIHPFKCEFCNKTFTQKGALHRHMPIHTGEAPFQCDLCGKRFLHHTSFNMHTLAHTGEKSYKCTLCGLALLSGSHLKRHMRVHTGERPFACDHCGKRFAERYNLAAHQRLHEVSPSELAKRSHHCQVCGATFDRRPKLEEHLANNHNKISEKDQTRNWIGHFIANT